MHSNFKYGLIAFVFFLVACSKASNSFIVDKKGILSANELHQLDSLFKKHEKLTSNELGIIITDCHQDSAILKYAAALGNEIGIGKKHKNNGLMLLICMNRNEIAITLGKGTEKVMNNSYSKKIIDSIMVPRFREANFYAGIRDAVVEITNYLEKPENKIK